jgi:hypothetical protein
METRWAEHLHGFGYKVFVSDILEYKEEVYDFVWGKNPYISGQKTPEPSDIFAGSLFQNPSLKLPNFILTTLFCCKSHSKKYSGILCLRKKG